jgi:hypothetical protein
MTTGSGLVGVDDSVLSPLGAQIESRADSW